MLRPRQTRGVKGLISDLRINLYIETDICCKVIVAAFLGTRMVNAAYWYVRVLRNNKIRFFIGPWCEQSAELASRDSL